MPPDSPRIPRRTDLHLHGWLHPAVLAAAGISVAAGFAQFAATAALPDVASAFGSPPTTGGSLLAEVGLSGTQLGLGLAVIRLSSLGGLPLSNAADHFGRRRVILSCVTAGLVLTALAALSGSFWWLIALLALGRPLLSATNAVAGVIAAEETASKDRAKAIGLITAAYGVGAGLTALLRGGSDGAIGFRVLFGLSALPLLFLPFAGRHLEEPERFTRLKSVASRTALGHVPRELRGTLFVTSLVFFGVTFVTGPANTFLFLYAERVVGVSPGVTAAAVIAAAPLGLIGLLVGRAAADRFGRRITAAVAHVLIAASFIVTYAGGAPAAIGGYLFSLVAGSAYAPAHGTQSAELFPTSVRATAAGWITVAGVLGAVLGLLMFGTLADRFGAFGPAAIAISVPVMLIALAYIRLPETMGMELEESAPDVA